MAHEALIVGAAPLHLALVFIMSHTAASRYAAIAQSLLDDQIEQALGANEYSTQDSYLSQPQTNRAATSGRSARLARRARAIQPPPH